MKNITPTKPFVISKTGYCAENLISDKYDVNKIGTEQWQADYTQKLLIESYKLQALFVSWFVYRNYDYLYQQIPITTLKIWKDPDLEYGEGIKRISHNIWDQWKNLQVNP